MYINTIALIMYDPDLCICMICMYIIYSGQHVDNAYMSIINAFSFRFCINVIMPYLNYTCDNSSGGRSCNVFCLFIVSVAYI